MEEKLKRERISWLDMARGLAIIFVVLCHVTESMYFYSDINISDCVLISKLFAYIAFSIGRLGVPLFLFISGYLLLQRTYDDKKCMDFWKHNLATLLMVTEIWIVIYWGFQVWFNHATFDFGDLIKNMLFLKPVSMPHFWYLPMLLGMYLFLPFVSLILHRVNGITLIVPFVIVAIYSFGVPTINILLDASSRLTVSNQLDLGFGGGVYGIYLICGYLFWRQKRQRVKKRYFLAGTIVLIVATALFQLYLLKVGYNYILWYDFIPLVAAAICLFSTVKNCNLSPIQDKIWNAIAVNSFGIYLVHKPIHYILMRYLNLDKMIIPGRVIVISILTFGISFFIVKFLAKVPKVGKVLFLIK